MRRHSMAFIYDYTEVWAEVEGFSKYMISNHKQLYKKSTEEYFYGSNTDLNKQTYLINDSGDKVQKRIIKFIKDTFQLKYDYIYADEIFYTIPTLKQYCISNYNRVINYKSGVFKNIIEDNNIIYVSNRLEYDNGQLCYKPTLNQLWLKVNGTEDCIDVNNEMNFMQEKEFYRYILSFPGYRVSNYYNIKNDEKDEYMTPQLKKGYYTVQLRYKNKSYTILVHKVVILVFKGEPPTNYHTVDHIDQEKSNNYPSNLQYATMAEQAQNKNERENSRN